MSEGAMAYMIPSPSAGQAPLSEYARDLDGLVLQGGSDVAPESYGDKPLKPEWGGDRVRDVYEQALFKEFHQAGKPVLGICRGLQLLNVAMGGTLIQDIGSQVPGALTHRDWEIYDQNFHELSAEPGSLVARAAGSGPLKVNSVHHQGIRKLAPGLAIEARCKADGMIEAVRGTEGKGWVYAVQWHPEFQDPKDETLLDCKPILREFLKHAQDHQSRD
jgi:putative glutamine amidotransferase